MAQDNKKLRRRVRGAYAVSTISISLVLFLLGAVGYLTISAFNVTGRLRSSFSMYVMLRDDIRPDLRDSIGIRLRAMPQVNEVAFTSREDAAAEFSEHHDTDFVGFLGFNPLPDSYEIKIAAGADAASLTESDVAAWEGVDEVLYQRGLASRIDSGVNKFNLVLVIFGGVLLVISVILLNNMIRVAVYSKRYVINTMKLVGASPGFILRPFVRGSIVQGLCAGAIASLLFTGMVAGLYEGLPEVDFVIGDTTLMLIVAGMIVCGVLISVIFTALAVGKFVRMPSDAVHAY